MHIQIFIPVKAYFFEREFNSQSSNLIITVKLPMRQIKDRQYSVVATDSHIGIKKTCERVHFLVMLQAICLQFY